MPTHTICARLACEVYKNNGGNPPDDWKIIATNYPKQRWNLGMAAYLNKDNELIIAYRGTEDIWDLIADFGLWQKQIHPNQEVGDRWSEDIIKKTAEDIHKKSQELKISEAALTKITELVQGLSVTYNNANLVSSMTKATFFMVVVFLISTGALAFTAGVPAILMGVSGLGMAALETIKQKLTQEAIDNLVNAERQLDITQLLNNVIKSTNLKSITIVGHSMGGFLAELTACRLKKANLQIPIEAITIDSPGCSEIATRVDLYINSNYDFITTYLSAPNIVNTCHHHLGTINRIYVPHVEKDWTWEHAVTSVGHSFFRATIYVGATALAVAGGATVVAAAAPTEGALAVSATTAANSALGVAGTAGATLKPAVFTRLTTGVIDATYRDKVWFGRQHSKDNIYACFKTERPDFYSKMESWPQLSTVIDFIATRGWRLFKSLIPLSNSNPGIRTIFNENWMRENQLHDLPYYIIKSHVGKKLDWVNEVVDKKPTLTP